MKNLTWGAAASAALLLAGTAQGAITIAVTPWSAPNAFGSPSFQAAEQNQFQAQRTGASSYGTPGTPTYYKAISGPIGYGEFIATNFNSWKGVANPGSPYQNELGNRIQYGLMINGNGQQFSISQLSFAFDGNGAGNYFDAPGPSYNYSPYDGTGGFVGILKGADGVVGTADDIFIDSGASTQLVDALIGRGSGMADAVTCGSGIYDYGPCGAGNQSYIDDEIAFLQADGFDSLKGTYRLTQSGNVVATGSATVVFAATAAVPEPATWATMMIGFGLIGAAARRSRARVIA